MCVCVCVGFCILAKQMKRRRNDQAKLDQGCDIRLFIHAIEEQPPASVLTAITFRCGCTIGAL